MPFSKLGLSSTLVKKLETQNYSKAYPIQEQAIPAILKKQDILGISQTGSGKTISFVLPILMNLQNNLSQKNRHISALVLVPTHELAAQVNEVFQLYASELPTRIKTLAIYGGVSINTQMQKLQGVHIVVATPGRLLDLVDSNALNLSDVNTLVLDEADKMLTLGFKNELDKVINLLPEKRQNLLFSATFGKSINTIKKNILKDPLVIQIEPELQNVNLINQSAYFIDDEKKGPLLRYIIKSKDLQQVLVFTSSVQRADWVANKLRANGIDARPIHSKKTQGVRSDLLTKFKYGKLRVLVATDLIARGIDIEFLPCVINYELPRSPKDYIHRIGRTGRAENPGEAISLIIPEEEHHFKIIQKKMGKWVDRIDCAEIDLNGY